PKSQNHPLISYASRHSLAIQIFEQWNRVLAADSRQIFEVGDVNFRRSGLERGDLVAKIDERTLVEDELLRNLDQNFVAQKQSDNLLGADLIHLQTRQHFFQRRNFQPSGRERLLDDRLGLGFFVFHNHAAAGQVDEFAGDFQLFFL